MHAARRGAKFPQWPEYARILRSAGVENDPTAQFLASHAGEFARHARYGVIRRSDQNDLRQEDVTRQAGMRLPFADESNRTPRGSFAWGDNDANLPSQFPQAAAERTPDAAGPDDGQCLFHLVLA